MADISLREMGVCLALMVELETFFVEKDEEIHEDIDPHFVIERIAKTPAYTPADLGVKASAIDYLLEHSPTELATMVESFLNDLRRLGFLPPGASQDAPPLPSGNVVKLPERERVLQLAA